MEVPDELVYDAMHVVLQNAKRFPLDAAGHFITGHLRNNASQPVASTRLSSEYNARMEELEADASLAALLGKTACLSSALRTLADALLPPAERAAAIARVLSARSKTNEIYRVALAFKRSEQMACRVLQLALEVGEAAPPRPARSGFVLGPDHLDALDEFLKNGEQEA
jgi:hypothetical protein